jgi:exodeoxyribonuclease VII small subunit
MSDATGAGGLRGATRDPEDERSGWPADDQQPHAGEAPTGRDDVRAMPAMRIDDIQGMSAASNDDIQGMSAAPIDDIQGMSYEAARDALVKVVDELERGGTTLERSLALWERGEALAARCEAWLTGARARLEAARAGAQSRSGG